MQKIKELNCTCEYCGKKFYKFKCEIDRGGGKFCSRECSGLSHRKRINIICKNCGIEFIRHCGKVNDNGNNFCSSKCHGEWMSKNLIGCNAIRWNGGGLSKTCVWCGKIFIAPLWKENSRNPQYCSIECVRNHNESNRIVLTCKYCSKEFIVAPHLASQKFCSKLCDSKWRSENLTGSNSKSWKDSILDSERHDRRKYNEYSNWRKLVFSRDLFTCQYCGDNHGGNLEAHHIIPFSKDKSLRTEISNGITLCKKCHKKEHKRLNNLKKQQLTIF